MRLLLLKTFFLKKQSNLLKILVEKSSQKNNSFIFVIDLTLLPSKINKRMLLAAKKCIFLSDKLDKDFALLSEKIRNRKITSTKKIIYSF